MKIGNVFIETVKSVRGTQVIDNAEQSEKFGRDPDFASKRVGPISLPQADETETACSLGAAAANLALASSRFSAEDIGVLLVVTQNPDFGGLPHNSAIIHGLLDLPTSTLAMDIGLGCSGFVYAAATAATLLKQGEFKAAMVITTDQYRRFLVPEDVSTNLLFGDWAAATIIANEGEFELKAFDFGTSGKDHQHLIRRENGIVMNGRAIFNFARKQVPQSVKQFCADQPVEISDVDVFLFHQGSKAVVEEITKELELDQSKVPIELEHTGNSVSSSLPLLYESHCAQAQIDRMIMCGFGVGLSWGTMLIERSHKNERS